MGLSPLWPTGFTSYHLLSCPTFCFNFLFFLYLRPLQPDLYGSQMCTGKLPEVRHRPKRSLHQSASLRCHSTAAAGRCVCSRFVAWLIPLFSLIPNSGGPCHTLFCRELRKKLYWNVCLLLGWHQGLSLNALQVQCSIPRPYSLLVDGSRAVNGENYRLSNLGNYTGYLKQSFVNTIPMQSCSFQRSDQFSNAFLVSCLRLHTRHWHSACILNFCISTVDNLKHCRSSKKRHPLQQQLQYNSVLQFWEFKCRGLTSLWYLMCWKLLSGWGLPFDQAAVIISAMCLHY